MSPTRFAWMVFGVTLTLEILLGISPEASRFTWTLENAPVWIGWILLLFTWRKFPLSRLCLFLLGLHAIILMVGGHYTYARVPLGNWVKDLLHLQRNHYDRLGHFAQGFIPAVLSRELLIRKAEVRKPFWIFLLTVTCCLAFSAFYELLEWWSALAAGKAADDFLATQGDIWDTQWDMFLALIGSLVSLTLLTKWHNRSMREVTSSPGR